MPLSLTSQGQVKIFHIYMKAGKKKKKKIMLPESDRARMFLLLNEVSHLYDSGENIPTHMEKMLQI